MSPTETEVPSSVAPKPVAPGLTRNNPDMFKIFHNVQYNVVQHKKYVKEMIKLYKKLDQDTFRASFKNALQYLFTFGDTSANVDRVIQFVATFCTSLGDEENFLLFVFDIIFECQCVSGQSVRYRASQLLAAVLSALGEDASLEEDLCDQLLASQTQRLQDTRGAVRCRAALALQRLQNPKNPEDPVTRDYRFHMSCDPSSSVRRAIVMTIAKSIRNVPYVLERICDVDEAVRRAAFLFIAAINVTQLKVRQRVLTLKVGLTERSARVRRVVEEILIPGWLATFQGNIVDLLTAIRLDNNTDAKDSQYVAGKLLESLFKRLPISELLEWLPTEKSLRLIPAEKLNKETAWYWRHLAEHLQKIDDDETLETILPDLVVLTGYIRAIVESPCPSETTDPVSFSTRQHVLHELGAMLRVYDVTDPASRTALHQLITDILTGDYGPLSSDVIRVFVEALELAVVDVSTRMEVVSGIITSLRDPPEPEVQPLPPPAVDCTEAKLQRARLRVSLNVAMEAQEDAVREQQYALAAECKTKVEELQKKLEDLNVQLAPPPPPITTIKERISDGATLTKCLTILNCALDTPHLKCVTPMMLVIFSELQEEIFNNPEITETALETVALYGMLDKEFAITYRQFFFQYLVDGTIESKVMVALRCIIDLLCVHGLSLFEGESNTTTDNNTTVSSSMGENASLSESTVSLTPAILLNTVIHILLTLMDKENAAYRGIIVEGLCRLLHLGHLESPAILSRLLLLWFNPATVEEDMLRQVIGVFFQTFPICVDGAQDQLQKATIPTLKTLANAPSSSPLVEIDQEAVVKFIVSLTRVNHETCDSQGGMAAVLCQHIARRPAAAEVGLACRMLALLSPPRDASLASSLAVTLRNMCLKLTDKQACRNLTRYLGALEATERASLANKMSTGVAEGTMQEDSLAPLGRTTSSLPQPIARSTHVVINETVEEEVEIDENSPTDTISRIAEEPPQARSTASPRTSSEAEAGKSGRSSSETEAGSIPAAVQSDSSDDVSPVKRAKATKGKKKKLSINRPTSEPEPKPTKSKAKTAKGKSQDINKDGGKTLVEKVQEDSDKGGVKRSRSQRSLVDLERAQKAKAEAAKSKEKEVQKQVSTSPPDFDTSNVTIRRSTATGQSGSSSDGSGNGDKKGKKAPAAKKTTKPTKAAPPAKKRDSPGSNRSSTADYQPFDDSDDSLHTIVYEKDFVQSVLNDSDDAETSRASKGNVTIPETPDASEESEPEPSPVPKPTKERKKKKEVK